jgi:Uma2 family endonuclease
VIIEVLSASTEAVDRGEKFVEYTKIAALREYFLISQNVAQVERWSRSGDGPWTPSVVTGLNGTMTIESIQCSLPLAEIYDQVVLSDADEDT